MNSTDPTRWLRLSLRANATFSVLSGLVFSVASGVIADFLGGVEAVLVLAVGLQLLLFAGALVWLASRPSIPAGLVIAVVVADLGWVLGTIVAVYADLFTRGGAIAALVVADLVLVFAILQAIGLRRARGGMREVRP